MKLTITLAEENSPHARRLRQLREAFFNTDQESFQYCGSLNAQQLKLIALWKRRAFALVSVEPVQRHTHQLRRKSR